MYHVAVVLLFWNRKLDKLEKKKKKHKKKHEEPSEIKGKKHSTGRLFT